MWARVVYVILVLVTIVVLLLVGTDNPFIGAASDATNHSPSKVALRASSSIGDSEAPHVTDPVIDEELILLPHEAAEPLSHDHPAVIRLVRHLRTKSEGMVLLGELEGDSPRGEFGIAVDISSDGTHIVVGAWGFDGFRGYVEVYRIAPQANGASAFVQKGQRILGTAPGDDYGRSVWIRNANEILVGAPQPKSGPGYAIYYDFVGGQWVPRPGYTFTGVELGDEFGFSVHGNELGFVAIGAPNANDAANGLTDCGMVRIFYPALSGPDPLQVMERFGEGDLNRAGFSVSLAKNAFRVVVGYPGASLTPLNDNVGAAITFQMDAVPGQRYVLVRVGDILTGNTQGELFGSSVSIDSSGTTVAVGAYRHQVNFVAGQVRVFRLEQILNGRWVQLGSSMDGPSSSGAFGFSTSLSDDGMSLVVGGYFHDVPGKADAGLARVFILRGDWVQRQISRSDADIVGDAAGDRLGHSVSMAGNGNRIVVGNPRHDGATANDVGQIKVYTSTMFPTFSPIKNPLEEIPDSFSTSSEPESLELDSTSALCQFRAFAGKIFDNVRSMFGG